MDTKVGQSLIDRSPINRELLVSYHQSPLTYSHYPPLTYPFVPTAPPDAPPFLASGALIGPVHNLLARASEGQQRRSSFRRDGGGVANARQQQVTPLG